MKLTSRAPMGQDAVSLDCPIASDIAIASSIVRLNVARVDIYPLRVPDALEPDTNGNRMAAL